MKKIIALAVAGAFVAPVYAAEITISGDVEFVFVDNGTATYGETGDADYTIQGSEEIQGLMVTASVDEDEDARLSVSGDFGKVTVGNDGTDNVLQAIDETAAFAEKGAGLEASPVVDGNDLSVMYATNVNGVNLMIGYAAGNEADNHTAVQYGVTFEAGPVSFGLAGENANVSSGTAEDALVYNVAATFGAISVAYEASSNRDNTADKDGVAFGGAYDYGTGKVFYESNKVENADGTTDSEVNAYGVSYKIGNLNTYISIADDKSETDNITYIGTEYKF